MGVADDFDLIKSFEQAYKSCCEDRDRLREELEQMKNELREKQDLINDLYKSISKM